MRSMNGGSFLDTNVLAYTDDKRAPMKQEVEDLQHGRRFGGLEVVNPFR
jgi:predicted nucleic acid-binding protein